MSVLHNEHEEFRRISIGFESPPLEPPPGAEGAVLPPNHHRDSVLNERIINNLSTRSDHLQLGCTARGGRLAHGEPTSALRSSAPNSTPATHERCCRHPWRTPHRRETRGARRRRTLRRGSLRGRPSVNRLHSWIYPNHPSPRYPITVIRLPPAGDRWDERLCGKAHPVTVAPHGRARRARLPRKSWPSAGEPAQNRGSGAAPPSHPLEQLRWAATPVTVARRPVRGGAP